MKQLAWALKAGVEVLLALVPVAFEDVTATLGEDDERTAVADRNGSHELLFTQVPEFTAAWVKGLAPAVPEVVGVHDAERAGRRQRPRFRAAQENAVLAEPHAFAVWAARQIEITSEHVTRVARVSFEDETPRLPWFSSRPDSSLRTSSRRSSSRGSSLQRASKSIETSFEEHARA